MLLYDRKTTRIKGLRRVRISRHHWPENNSAWCSWWLEVSENLTSDEHSALEIVLSIFRNNATANLRAFLKAASRAEPVYFDSRGKEMAS